MENHPPNRGIWNQNYNHHSPIFHSFRISKPLLHPLPHRIKGSMGTTESISHQSNSNRIPLMDLSTNTPPPHKRLKPDPEISPYNSISSSQSFVTPLKVPERVTLNSDDSTSSFFDDDIDDSMLQEIDMICEQSARKKACQTPSISITQTPSKDNNNNSGLKAGFGSMFESSTNVKLELDKETTIVTDPALISDMPDECSKFMQSLNDRQRDAASSEISTPLMVIAGPGSGKTSTMVGRVLVLLNQGLLPSNILAMTFTTAATAEMRERIGKSAGKKAAKEITISTFHSFSLQLCRMHAEKLQRTSEFSVYGHGQQRRAIIEAVRLYEEEKKNASSSSGACESKEGLNGAVSVCPEYAKDISKKWQKYVTQGKASGRTPEECCKMGNEIGAKILGNYNDISGLS